MKTILNLIKIKNLNFIFCISFLLIYSLNLYSSENKIIFKINDIAFTSLDLEKRLEYLDFVSSNTNIDQKIIINDFISANLFYEYYKKLKIENFYDDKIQEIFDNIYNLNKQNNKKYDYKIETENILKNIRIDYIRKIVLENFFNSSFKNINTSNEEIDLLYNIKIKYLNLNITELNKIKNKITNFETLDYDSMISLLNENKLVFFTKEKEINNINKINSKIKDSILLNNNFLIIENNLVKSFIFIKKNFETLDGIIVDLFRVKSEVELDNNFLKCENLMKKNKYQNIINKEYKLVDLNINLKENLININDYVKYSNDNEYTYIVLCRINFDKEILNNNNFNKEINLNISEIEKKFINKYSKIYNLIMFNE